MTTYYKQTEIKASMKVLVDEYLKECKTCDVLPEDFVDLIKHNFLAKYVCYNKDTKTIEIGVENSSSEGYYPEIKVHKFPINSDASWMERSFRSSKNDLSFYGKLLNRQFSKDAEVVLM